MTIIIGRGRSKATQRIDITDPTVSREHCWLTANGDGTYTLQNKSSQGTFIGGRKVVKTQVTPNTIIKLSETTFVKVADLLPLQQTDQSTVPAFSLVSLKDVWEDYHNKQLEIKNNQRSIALFRSASPLFTLGSGSIATLVKTMGWGDAIFGLTIVMTIIGLFLMVYSFIKGYKDKSIEETEKAIEIFQNKYVCPNPKCRHFMGNYPYNIIRQNKSCPWCKCKFKE